jgi:hypothetical protein
MMPEIQTVTIELARPRGGNNPGKVAVGHFVVEDGTVVLTDKKGIAVDRHRFSRKLKDGESARSIACILTRQQARPKSGDFDRVISYPKVQF